MKAFKQSEKSFSMDEIVCPICGKPVIPLSMKSTGVLESTDALASRRLFTESEQFSSTDARSKHHIDGNIFLCSHCNELMFLYSESDRRVCADCKHCKHTGCSSFSLDRRDYTCLWYNYPMASHGWRGLDCPVCSHVDEDLCDLPTYAVCGLCVHYRKDRSCRDAPHQCKVTRRSYDSNLNEKELFSLSKACCDFAPDLVHYKNYRDYMDNQGSLFDESIHIPEFDEFLKDPKFLTEKEIQLLWHPGSIPITVRISEWCMDKRWFMFTVYYEGNLIFCKTQATIKAIGSNTKVKRFITDTATFALEDFITSVNMASNPLHEQVSDALLNHAYFNLHMDVYDLCKKHRDIEK